MGFRELPLVELSLLAMCLSRGDQRWAVDRLRGWFDFALPIFGDPRFRERRFREPEKMVPHMLLAIALERCGLLPREAYTRHTQALIEVSSVMAASLPPHRTMELRYVLDLGGLPHRLPSYSTLYRRTLLRHNVNPIYVTSAEAYVVTHVIFYLSDLGSRRVSGLREREVDGARRLVHELLGIYLVAGNWDLVAELLLAWDCLEGAASALYEFGWSCLLAAQRDDGAIPGTSFGRAEACGEVDKPARMFESCYHATLVAALAAATSRVARFA